ncbi:M48 family metallopeptidase [uncultured Sunxiuqinia sp.]|uniref:M48 family metallopeptidase n=1 Tax=uncultured Sunxiuqinia sp. TaxID=1573825 RepID=UPI00260D7F53|nr:M48 family metallopeptidase [uncultured Sunxiuqinia sp.]
MKNYLFAALMVVLTISSTNAQDVYVRLDVAGSALKKISKDIQEGDQFEALILKGMADNTSNSGYPTRKNVVSVIKTNGEVLDFDYSKKFEEDLNLTITPESFWTVKALQARVYNDIIEAGFQYDVRNYLEEESLDYLSYLSNQDAFVNDAVIKDYLQSIFLKIYQKPINDGRLGQLDIRILKNNEPYAAILPNGTALISIGLLNLVNTEEELTAVLAHETAHFILDHAVKNINLELKKQKRAEFWAGVTSVAVAATATYASVNHDIYVDPSIISTSAALAYTISSQISERVGLKYSREQEMAADNCAAELMEYLGYNKDALGSVLSKLKDYYYYTGNFKVFSDEGTHPNISYRIENVGIPEIEYRDTDFDKKISDLLTQGAYYEYSKSHFQTCEKLLWRNIKSGAATEEDYILMALVNLAQYNTSEKYAESLNFLEKANQLGINPDYQTFKVESLIHLRKNDELAAINALSRYQTELQEHLNSIDLNLLTSNNWMDLNSRLNDELIWTKKMLFKMKK